MSGTRRIEQAIRIGASPARTWRALTEPAELARWLCRRAEPAGDGRLRIEFGEDHGFEIEFVERDEPSRLVLRWGAGGNTGDRLSFRLSEAHGGTRIELEHEGFPNEAVEDWAGHVEGWAFYPCNLRTVLERDWDLRPEKPSGTIAG